MVGEIASEAGVHGEATTLVVTSPRVGCLARILPIMTKGSSSLLYSSLPHSSRMLDLLFRKPIDCLT